MNQDLELVHHGIKGMKWGVRRSPEQLGYSKAERRDRASRAREVGNLQIESRSAAKGMAKDNRKIAKAEKKVGKAEAAAAKAEKKYGKDTVGALAAKYDVTKAKAKVKAAKSDAKEWQSIATELKRQMEHTAYSDLSQASINKGRRQARAIRMTSAVTSAASSGSVGALVSPLGGAIGAVLGARAGSRHTSAVFLDRSSARTNKRKRNA